MQQYAQVEAAATLTSEAGEARVLHETDSKSVDLDVVFVEVTGGEAEASGGNGVFLEVAEDLEEDLGGEIGDSNDVLHSGTACGD